MSDWQVGDLALCIRDWPAANACGIFAGRVYTVDGVTRGRVGYSDHGEIGLFLRGIAPPSPSGAVVASRFRKIRPDEHEACEPEFVTLLKRSKRKVSA